MRKTLLTTTALSLFAASSAFAEAGGPTVTLGGSVDVQVGGSSQQDRYENIPAGGSTRKDHSRVEADLEIAVDGKSDNGLGYGGKIILNADPSEPEGTADSANEGENSTDVSIYVESVAGRVEAGATHGAGKKLTVNAGTIARATGGIAGDFHEYITLTGAQSDAGDAFVVTPDLPSIVLPGDVANDVFDERGKANKISYYTPRIQGFQGGISYTLDQAEKGTSTRFSGGQDDNNDSFEHVWEFAANYQAQYDQIGVEASAVFEHGDNESDNTGANELDDLEAYELGLSLSYAGFTIAGSYAGVDEFGQTTNQTQSYDYWTVGGAYEFGPFAASVTYLDSEVENGSLPNNTNGQRRTNAEFENLVVGADYQLAPGLVPYVEVSFFNTDDGVADSITQEDNDGTVVIVGTELTF